MSLAYARLFNPFRERGWAGLMLALYRLGRQAEALDAYRTARRIIIEELGLEPTPALRRLEEQILHQSPELDGPPPPVPGGAWTPTAGLSTDATVAFLFTDIEASTRRWEGEREAMAQDLARHDELLRREVQIAGGEVFSHTGDGLAAAFVTASAALSAAVAAQQELQRTHWTAGGDMRVRMAVHAGAAERRGGNYFGPTLNRVARLLDIASGGQVLCSATAADLARDDLPAGVSLLDLGDHALADLARPERILQVVAPGLPSTFAPLRSPGARGHNLPVALTPFVGRVSELGDLRGIIGTTRLLTLTGVGGAGKTRLAVEVASAAMGRFPDGAWFVDLGPLRDPDLVVAEVCKAMGVPSAAVLERSAPPEEQLCAHLRRRCGLIVLDNCEHLVEATAALVHTLLSECPDVSVLTTSREVLGLAGEIVWRVPPLSLPPALPAAVEDLSQSDAAALFLQSARAAQPGFALSSDNVGSVARICRRLDGIPLAIELAAARIRVLSAHQVAERLDDRFRLLTGGARSAVPRHQTLRATMDWSYEALPGAEQSLLRRLSVFPASFDLAAAEAVASDGDSGTTVAAPGFEVLDLLSRLVDKSLVTVQSGSVDVRYRLLETVRQYAAELLAETGEALAIQRRHRDHFLRVAEDGHVWWWHCTLERYEEWIWRVDVDDDNFRVALASLLEEADPEPALRLAAAMFVHWFWTGWSPGIGWLERLLKRSSSIATPARMEALLGLSMLVGNPEHASQGLRLAEELEDRDGQAEARLVLGTVALRRGDVDEAQRLLSRALDDCDEAYLWAKAWCHYELGNAAVAAGDVAQAGAHLEQALRLFGNVPIASSQAVSSLAPVAALAGLKQRADALAEEAVTRATRLGLPIAMGLALTRATEARILTGDFRRARSTLRQLLELLRDLGGRRFLADALEMAAVLAEEDGRPAVVARLLSTCRVMREADGEPVGGTRAISLLVRLCDERMHEGAASVDAEKEGEGGQLSATDAMTYALSHLEDA